jgi:hypothetical protein
MMLRNCNSPAAKAALKKRGRGTPEAVPFHNKLRRKWISLKIHSRSG